MPKLVFDWLRFFPYTRRAFLENGITTVRDLGNEHGWIMELRRQLQDGSLEGPRLFAAGPIFTTPGGHPVATFGVDPASDSVRLPSTPEDARRAVSELASGESRVDLIKVVQERGRPERSLEPIAPGVLDAIVTEAYEQDLVVTAHWGRLEDLEDVLVAGVDGLEHVKRERSWMVGRMELWTCWWNATYQSLRRWRSQMPRFLHRSLRSLD